MRAARSAGFRRLALVTALAAAVPAAASSLQVAPTGLDFPAGSSAQALWLTNTGSEELAAQVRAFAWSQAAGEDVLEPTRNLVASPPMLRIAPGARQLVRVIRSGGTPSANEQSYRIVVDELPPPQDGGVSGVQYVLRYSVPAFVAGSAGTPPALAWTTTVVDGALQLDVRNDGATHAQLTAISLLGAEGTPTPLHPGLLGYVLPGANMRWHVAVPAGVDATNARIEAQVNGNPTALPPPAGALPR
jgi:fimbrial chaperone protein